MKNLNQIKTNSPESQISIRVDEKIDEKIKIDFSYFLFPSVYLKFFTNFLKNKDDCFEKIKIFFHQALPYFFSKSFKDLENENRHCHSIDSIEKVSIINKILRKYSEKYPEFILPTYTGFGNEFYQLPGPRGIRAIGVRRGNIFVILFLDFHHLIYSSECFNNQDYTNYNFEVHQMLLSEKNITLVSLSDEILNNPNCLSCEHLEKMTF